MFENKYTTYSSNINVFIHKRQNGVGLFYLQYLNMCVCVCVCVIELKWPGILYECACL